MSIPVRPGPVLTTKGAADYCGLSYTYFRQLLNEPGAPRRYKNGSKNAFYPADLDEWLATRLVPMSP